MPRKRRISKIRRGDLDPAQEFDLVLNRSPLGGPRQVFQNAIERKAAWYANRDYLINEAYGAGPGRRPGGWWAYECPKEIPREERDRPNQEEDWEILLALGEMDEEERAAVLGEWVKTLHLRQGFLCMTYRDAKEGVSPTHGNPPWEDLKARYERQAHALGPQAEGEWQGILEEVTKDAKKQAPTKGT